MDFPGGTLLHMVVSVASPLQCQRLCAEYPGCEFFSYATNFPPRCWLRGEDAVASRTEDPDRISGPRSCTGSHRPVDQGRENISMCARGCQLPI